MTFTLRGAVFSSLVAAGVTATSGAFAFTAAPLPAGDAAIENIAYGCGPGWHPNAWGRCVPNYYGGYGVYGGPYYGGGWRYGYGGGWHGGGWHGGGWHGGGWHGGGWHGGHGGGWHGGHGGGWHGGGGHHRR